MFHPARDANPFFHFFEGLWMLAGRNDVASVAHFVPRMATFSDDGSTLHGAYGHRWRIHFGFDQLGHIIEALKENPDDRRNVLAMWDANVDLGRVGKDIPCNTQAYFTRDSSGALDMTVCCRSNDMIWGAYGANAVHFSMLQEYMASAIGCKVGEYWQISNNFHSYLDTFNPLKHLADEAQDPYRTMNDQDPYSNPAVAPYPMMNVPVGQWQQDLQMFLEEGMVLGFHDSFFRKVANPIVSAWNAFKETERPDKYTTPIEILNQCAASDWKRACTEWIIRRHVNWEKAQADGPGQEE